MLLSPRRFKYRKQQKGRSVNRVSVNSKENNNLLFGSIGLKYLVEKLAYQPLDLTKVN